ncbi:flagellar hook-associated protein FlgK [Adhaeretor mobilis]|uniref:Flagellar hook-associated protein 1 n=1 Tax=Adhaeretor mobilis TaxID=1930276 RepID=A0A517MTV9_9BACT|nr:flagellar hook-associated protein FlgK [Adhaeretor mobilis]QDS98321.1 flagellar hook-associated protein FlgK [Adhaeretor mobilis]
MSLFGSIQLAGNALNAMQIGLQVVGNNIANANTPGYVREKAIFSPAPTQQIGKLTLGLGVEVDAIVQQIDRFAVDRLRDASGDRASADIQEKVYRDIEAILGELSDTDISTELSNFFNSIDNVSGEDSVPVRELVVEQGVTLTTKIANLHRRVSVLGNDFNQQVEDLASEVNTLAEEVRQLNLNIVTIEGGEAGNTEAGGLRSQRQSALSRLSEIVDLHVTEGASGLVNLSVGGQFLVFEGTRSKVQVDYSTADGQLQAKLEFVQDGSDLQVSGGELHGIYQARDGIVGEFLGQLDRFAGALANEFNKQFSSGQGISGFRTVTGTEAVSDAGFVLDEAGLTFAPVNGSFDLLLHNKEAGINGQSTPHTIQVDLNGLDGDDTLTTLAAKIDAIEGVTAEVTVENKLRLSADSADVELGFSNDTSGALASLGINTFFTGDSAATLGVNQELQNDASKFAASNEGIGDGTGNSVALGAFQYQGLESYEGNTVTDLYDQLINSTTQGSTVASAVADGLRNFEATLDASVQSLSGVNIDEEAIDMILLQRTYQASARYLSTLSELLDVLINI